MEHHHEGHHSEGHGGHGHGAKKNDQFVVRLSKKNIALILAIIILCVLGYRYKSVFVAATVDGTPITRWSVIRELEQVSGKQALDALIVQELIDKEAKEKGVVATPEEVEAEITKIRTSIVGQGATLEELLAQQGRTIDKLKKQIYSQKVLEKLVADRITITPDEIKQFIKDNKVTIPSGQEEKYDGLIRDEIYQQKLGNVAKIFVDELRINASIKTFVSY